MATFRRGGAPASSGFRLNHAMAEGRLQGRDEPADLVDEPGLALVLLDQADDGRADDHAVGVGRDPAHLLRGRDAEADAARARREPPEGPELPAELERPGERDAGGECPLGGPLDDRAVGERVGEGHAELDDVRTPAGRLPDEPARVPERGVARREVRDQRPLPPGPEGVERLREPRHRPSAPLTTWTSLSPAPERPTTIVCRRGR